jgi:hypothetical protein
MIVRFSKHDVERMAPEQIGMPSPTTSELLRAGIAAAQRGDARRARLYAMVVNRRVRAAQQAAAEVAA